MSLARLALRDLLNFMSEGNGRVGIMDATNSSVQRRRMVERECGRLGVQVFWVESICDRDSVIDDNIYKVKVSSVTATLPPSWNCLHADRTLLF